MSAKSKLEMKMEIRELEKILETYLEGEGVPRNGARGGVAATALTQFA